MDKIKVVHINTSATGGAAIACHRLHKLFLSVGIKSDVIHLYDNYAPEEGYHSIKYTFIRRCFNHTISCLYHKDLKTEAYVFSEPAPLTSYISNNSLVREADVIYLHWVLGGFFSKRDFYEIAKLGKPVFCYTHDMWWVTGGCHYSFECNGYREGCQSCHLHKHIKSLTHLQIMWKKELYDMFPNIHFISPSRWIKECVSSSFAVSSNRCTFIPNVVPDDIFKYIPKKEARKKLGLPEDKILISFGTADNSNKIKGFNYLLDALSKYHNDNIVLCVYGSDYDERIASAISTNTIFLGRITDERKMALVNAASDIFISPTLAESFGQTLLENIKCGTPVISTNCTAVPEIVIHKKNGFLVEPRNSEQIIEAMNYLIENPIDLSQQDNKMFSDKSIIEQHIRIIVEKLGKANPHKNSAL